MLRLRLSLALGPPLSLHPLLALRLRLSLALRPPLSLHPLLALRLRLSLTLGPLLSLRPLLALGQVLIPRQTLVLGQMLIPQHTLVPRLPRFLQRRPILCPFCVQRRRRLRLGADRRTGTIARTRVHVRTRVITPACTGDQRQGQHSADRRQPRRAPNPGLSPES